VSDGSSNVSCSLGGCLPIVLTVLLLWALLFGVTYGGKHHGVGCSCERGVTVE